MSRSAARRRAPAGTATFSALAQEPRTGARCVHACVRSVHECSVRVSLTFALQVHHGLVPLVLVRLVLRGDGETLGPGVEHDHVLVLGVGPLVDVEARLQRHGFLRHGGLAAEFLLALVVLEPGRAALRGGAEHEVPPVHGLLLAEVAALPHVFAALVLAHLALHDTLMSPPVPTKRPNATSFLALVVFVQVFREVIQTSPGSAPLPLSHINAGM